MHDIDTSLLSDYLDGGLDSDRKKAVEEHLRECAECSSTLAALRSVVAEARALKPRAPSEKVWAAISREVAEETSAPRSPTFASRRLPSPLLAAAALILAMLLGAGGSAWWVVHHPPAKDSGTRWLLLLHETAGAFDASAKGESMEKIIARYAAWNRDHAQLGEKLADSGRMRLDRSGLLTELASVDPIGGLFIIEAADKARAIEIARTCPHLDYGGWIEVRRIEDASHEQAEVQTLGYAK